jgi:hypothetical protein
VYGEGAARGTGGAGPQEEENHTSQIYTREELETLFIEGVAKENGDITYPNLRQLADYTGSKYETIRAYSSRHRWPEKKQAHQLQLARERQKRQAAMRAKEATDFDQAALDAAKLGIAMLSNRLAEIARDSADWEDRKEDLKARIEAGLQVDKKELYPPVYHKEMLDIASALSTFQQVGMRALGTDVNRVEVSGPDGGPVESTVSVVQEMRRDDVDRLSSLVEAIMESGLMSKEEVLQLEGTDDNVVDVEVVNETEGTGEAPDDTGAGEGEPNDE